MSNLWADRQGLEVRRADLWSAGEGGAASAAAAEVADAYARGLADGRRTVEAEVMGERGALVTLLHAIEGLSPPDPSPVAALIAATVVRLVSDIAGRAPIDEALLAARADALAALAVEAAQPVLVAHPDDLALLDTGRLNVATAADPMLARGTLQLRAGHLLHEDGVACAQARLRDELARIEAAA